MEKLVLEVAVGDPILRKELGEQGYQVMMSAPQDSFSVTIETIIPPLQDEHIDLPSCGHCGLSASVGYSNVLHPFSEYVYSMEVGRRELEVPECSYGLGDRPRNCFNSGGPLTEIEDATADKTTRFIIARLKSLGNQHVPPSPILVRAVLMREK
jgi:hypothetical protein